MMEFKKIRNNNNMLFMFQGLTRMTKTSPLGEGEVVGVAGVGVGAEVSQRSGQHQRTLMKDELSRTNMTYLS